MPDLEKASRRMAAYRKTDKGKRSHQGSQERYRRRLRAEAIDAYGGKCKCCGESNPGFMAVAFVGNNPEDKIQKKALSFHLELRKRGFPKYYRLLCFNCNYGMAFNYGVCPHHQTIVEITES